ncbi:hypothetical protein M378DRAFT_800119 [Amanita muscaria Koide BX008]|uniref:FAD dependent oxidoreductase domain-containing protein n=1 Tax=Amanita muscaria (strain Koide BX008) TaxID=946122 RepID=A0A0C2X0Q9_AMAMK|nr:hypothetical protein M378DRAFT_800119 [Amanita muscaria Koide BX008]
MAESQQSKQIIVVGAGVIGLSTAIKIQERGGYKVTVVAELFPTDPKDVRYTSNFAGAQFVAVASRDDLKQQQIERDTFAEFQELSTPGSAAEHCFLRLQQTEFYAGKTMKIPYYEEYAGYRALEKDELLPNVDAGLTFDSLTVDPPRYLNYLMSRFLGAGGIMVRAKVQHINQLIEGGASVFQYGSKASPQPPHAVIVCAGLGTRDLGGVEDKQMVPVRGQTVLVRAPWIGFGKSVSDEKGSWTYVIPRKNGNVILGGVKNVGVCDPSVWKETTRDILRRNLAMFPDIAPPGIRETREPTIEDLIPYVVEENVGFRPVRQGGLRLEVELLGSNKGPKIPVVYNYGHGPYGFIMSWGSANVALELMESALVN